MSLGGGAVNVRFLETFVWVARLGSFRLTAEKLSTTQAAVSSRIAALENSLGAKLFLRDARGATLTTAGRTALEHAERMLEEFGALRRALNHDAPLAGRLRLGVMDTVVHSWLGAFCRRMVERFPGVEIELSADTSFGLIDLLRRGQLDVILQTDVVRVEEVFNRRLMGFPLGWVVAVGSELDRDPADLEALARERLLTFSRLSRPHQDLLEFFGRRGIKSPRIGTVNSVAAIIQLVSDGFGIGVIPPALISTALDQGRMRCLALPTPPAVEVYASWRGGVGLELGEAVSEVAVEVVEAFCREQGEARARLD
ncbi:LysR family transcriptional regulator [Halotalea alkalilenta]|uniref:LysR family transcriptional regulator n=1 Tax=Halotalea alkalilenta TaxID=376489 RepID=UPI001CBB4B0E|nr:LysR family transcriptional regulator [Halotalea alkalilenta]